MGLRHLVVLDGEHRVTGMLTRHDLTEHRLEHHWFSEGDHMQKFIIVDPADAAHYIEVPLDSPNLPGDNNSGDRGSGNWTDSNVWNSIQLTQQSAVSDGNGGYVPPSLPVPSASQGPQYAQPTATSARATSSRSKNLKEPKTMASV
jgi:hypothetical protein